MRLSWSLSSPPCYFNKQYPCFPTSEDALQSFSEQIPSELHQLRYYTYIQNTDLHGESETVYKRYCLIVEPVFNSNRQETSAINARCLQRLEIRFSFDIITPLQVISEPRSQTEAFRLPSFSNKTA